MSGEGFCASAPASDGASIPSAGMIDPEQQARKVLAATLHDAECPENPQSWSFRNRRDPDPLPCVCDRVVRAMIAFRAAQTGEVKRQREALERLVGEDAIYLTGSEHDDEWVGGMMEARVSDIKFARAALSTQGEASDG